MKEEAKKQFESISIPQIKEVLKQISIDKFDKMIIYDGQLVKRSNYVFAKLRYQKIEREVKKVQFPLHSPIKDYFAQFEGGESKFGSKAKMKSEHLFEILAKNYQIKSQIENTTTILNPFEFPLDTTDDEINLNQTKYFIPSQTYQEVCDKCNGGKYITCPDHLCNGRHKWSCTHCHGNGSVV